MKGETLVSRMEICASIVAEGKGMFDGWCGDIGIEFLWAISPGALHGVKVFAVPVARFV